MDFLKRSFSNLTLERFLSLIILGFVCWYIFLCILHYSFQLPLWNDEACLFDSIPHFNNYQIFNIKLRADQTCPRVYFFLIQKVSRPFDFSLRSLRLLPFLSMIGAFLVWLRLASYEFREKSVYLIYTMSWCASAVLIYYSAELKQYSMDVLAAAVLLLFIYNQKWLEERLQKGRYILLLISLPFLVFFSYPSYLFLIFPLYNLVLSVRGDKKYLSCLIAFLISLLVVGCLSYRFDMRLAATTAPAGFQDYFVHLDSVPKFFQTFGEGTNNLFSRWFVERPRILKKTGIFFVVFGFIYMLYGFFRNIKKDKYRFISIKTVAFVVFIELFILGALKKYPFTVPRTSLFFCPVVLALTLHGICALKGLNRYLYWIVHSAYVCYLVFIIVNLSGVIFAGKLGFCPVLW